jgi:hypothetical protein
VPAGQKQRLFFVVRLFEFIPLVVVDVEHRQHALDAADLLASGDIGGILDQRSADEPLVVIVLLVFEHECGAVLGVDIEQHVPRRVRLDGSFIVVR